nr:hypothetical protein [Treponema sp.]
MKLSKKLLAALSATALIATAAFFTSCGDDDDSENSGDGGGSISFSGSSYKCSLFEFVGTEEIDEDTGYKSSVKESITPTSKTLTAEFTIDSVKSVYVASYTNPKTESNGTITYQTLSSLTEDGVEATAEKKASYMASFHLSETESDDGKVSSVLVFTDATNATVTSLEENNGDDTTTYERTTMSYTYTVDSEKKTVTLVPVESSDDGPKSIVLSYSSDVNTLSYEGEEEGGTLKMTFDKQ